MSRESLNEVALSAGIVREGEYHSACVLSEDMMRHIRAKIAVRTFSALKEVGSKEATRELLRKANSNKETGGQYREKAAEHSAGATSEHSADVRKDDDEEEAERKHIYHSGTGLRCDIWPNKAFYVGALDKSGNFFEGTYCYFSNYLGGGYYASKYKNNKRTGEGTYYFDGTNITGRFLQSIH